MLLHMHQTNGSRCLCVDKYIRRVCLSEDLEDAYGGFGDKAGDTKSGEVGNGRSTPYIKGF